MSILQTSHPVRKPSRTTKGRTLSFRDGVLRIKDARSDETYRMLAIYAPAGDTILGYRLTKADGESYDVQPASDECECRGWLRWGHCKHLASIAKLREMGRLPR